MACFSCVYSRNLSAILIIVGVVWIYVCQAPSADPCLNAVKIGDFRRSRNFVPSVEDPLLCDLNVNESLWYRFDAVTGGKIPESCVTTLHCGTMLPIWMDDVHPTAANPGPKAVKLCAPYWVAEVNCCDWTEEIKVLWCLNKATHQEYFVYQLKKPPFCSMSYCAGDGLACSKDCSWNGVKNSCSCPSYPGMTAPILKEPRIVAGQTLVRNAYPPGELFYPTRFVVDCVIGYPQQQSDNGARFDVIFEADGLYVARFTANSTDPVVSLDESYLIGYMGRTVTCIVSSYWDSSDAGSKYLLSNGRWFGLSPVDEGGSAVSNNLVVKEGQFVSFWLLPTFPITTRPCFDVPKLPCFYKAYSFSVHASESVMRLSDCTVVVAEGAPRSKEIKISPIPSIGGRPTPYIWQLSFNVYSDAIMIQTLPGNQPLTPIFKNYQIQSINVEIFDSNPQPACQSTGDPHILAFPDAAGNRAYYHIYSVGDFYLVRLQSRNLEIQVKHVPCNPASTVPVSCNCGVIVREGNIIFGINACNQPTPLLVSYRLDKTSPTGTIQTTPTGWKMNLLSGIEIDANIAGWDKRFMDIYVNGLRSELTQYDGLCSVQGLNDVECTTACDRYRVSPADSFFNINSNNLPKCGTPYVVPTCECYGKNIDESVNVACNQPTGDDLLQVDCTTVCSSKRKRAADSTPSTVDTIDLDDLYYAPPPPPSQSPPPTPLEPPVNPEGDGIHTAGVMIVAHKFLAVNPPPKVVIPVIGDEEAANKCTESLKKSPVYNLCISRIDTRVIIDTCTLDIKLLNSFGPADSAPTQLELACLRSIKSSLDDPEMKNNEELKSILQQVESKICPLQCNYRGQCANGVCQCNAGYIGVDCSLRKGQVPSVLRIISPVCDIRQQPCKTIYVQATDLASPESVTCKMRFENSDISGPSTVQYSKSAMSGGVVVCSLLQISLNRSDERFSETDMYYSIQVSITNDAATYSQEHAFAVYDGRYAACSARPAVNCQPKPNASNLAR